MLIRTKVEEVVEVWRLFRISLCRISYDLLITFFLYKISDKERFEFITYSSKKYLVVDTSSSHLHYNQTF